MRTDAATDAPEARVPPRSFATQAPRGGEPIRERERWWGIPNRALALTLRQRNVSSLTVIMRSRYLPRLLCYLTLWNIVFRLLGCPFACYLTLQSIISRLLGDGLVIILTFAVSSVGTGCMHQSHG